MVLDASALLAVLHAEPGSEAVEPLLDGASMSTVNWSEVLQKSLGATVDVAGLQDDIERLGIVLRPFTPEDAARAADVWRRAPRAGLSLGDRACLALAGRLAAVAVTADRTWARLRIGVRVQVVR